MEFHFSNPKLINKLIFLQTDSIKGTSRGLTALQSYMNDSYHKSVWYKPEPTINPYP